MNGELFLTSYTILSQAAIGLVVMMFVGSLFIGDHVEQKRYYQAFLTASILSMIAMFISAMHLGSPFRAMNSLGNLGSSWLSREILMTNLFFMALLWGVYATKKGGCYKTPLLVSSVVGMFCVLCQAAIYAHTVIPAWGFGHAYITFFAATFVMGSFLAAYFLLCGKNGMIKSGSHKVLIIYTMTAFIAMVFAAGFYSIFAGLLAEAGRAGDLSLSLLGDYNAVMVFRWVCTGIAILGLAKLTYQKTMNSSIVMLIVLIILGEALNRIVFYGIGVNIGL